MHVLELETLVLSSESCVTLQSYLTSLNLTFLIRKMGIITSKITNGYIKK